jgi:long-chain acyl-CoA synthetase
MRPDPVRAARTREGEEHGAYAVAAPTVGDLLDLRATKLHYEKFLVFYEADGTRTELTYAGLRSRVERAATLLSDEFGVTRGDRVATLMGNHPDTLLFYFGTMILGGTVVPINKEETEDRIRWILDDAGAKVLVAEPDAAEKALACAGSRPVLRTGPKGAGPGFAVGTICDDGPIMLPGDPVEGDDPALLVFTSGTTGLPKGVLLSQYNLLADARAIAEWHGIGPSSRTMCVLPIHHVNGIVVTVLTPLYAGSSTVLNRKFSSTGFWKRLADEKVAVVSVVPTLLHFLVEKGEDPRAHDLAAFRHFICGAGPLTVELAARFEDRFSFPVVHGYGLSETTCYSCFLPADLSPAEHRVWMREHGFPSIGVPVPSNDMAIHDPSGRALGEGERGEIVVRGHNVMLGYWKNPEANETTFAHGWFRSGDEGFWRRGADGRPYFFITGRIKDLIARGGVKFAPLEIDEVLSRIPGVRRGVAVGFENDAYGEEVGAVVQLEDGAPVTEAEILRRCSEALPFAKRPKVVRFASDLPFTATGKIQRSKLRPLFEEFRSVQFREESR